MFAEKCHSIFLSCLLWSRHNTGPQAQDMSRYASFFSTHLVAHSVASPTHLSSPIVRDPADEPRLPNRSNTHRLPTVSVAFCPNQKDRMQ
jgi:hypothetical protein